MSGPIANKIRAKVTRAEQHIQDFQLGLSAFLKTSPYGIAIKENPNGGYPIYYVSKVNPTPDTLAATAADVVQNLRSALDTLAYQLVLGANGGTKPKGKVYFPISKTPTDYKGTRRGNVKGVRQEVVDAIDATEPYKGGKGHALWQLQQLSNADKHELLIEAGVAVSMGVDIGIDFEHMIRKTPGFENIAIPPIFIREVGDLRPMKVGDELYIGPAEPEVAQKRRFAFNVSIYAPGIVDNEPAVKTLKRMSDVVGSIVTDVGRFLP
jgi:hypothetical protein